MIASAAQPVSLSDASVATKKSRRAPKRLAGERGSIRLRAANRPTRAEIAATSPI